MPVDRRLFQRVIVVPLAVIDLFFKRNVLSGIKAVPVQQQKRQQP